MQQAIQDCNDQLELMESATTAANSAASNANEKATACETATSECQTATSSANSAASSANSAAESANQIVQNWEGVGLDDINADINALKTWKTNVEAGQTYVIVETEEETEGS